MICIELFFFFGAEFTIFVPILWCCDGKCRVRIAQFTPVSAILKRNASTTQRIVINPDELDMSPFRDIMPRVAIVLFEIWTKNDIYTGNLSYHNFLGINISGDTCR